MIKVRGVWTATMTEPDHEGSRHEVTEKVRLKQWGGFVWGELSAGSKDRRFAVKGDVYHGLFSGKFERHGARHGSTAGRGVFMLKITEDCEKMVGHSAWFDQDTGQIECSEYVWERSEP